MKTFLTIALMLLAAEMLPAQTMNSGWFGSLGIGVAAHDNGPFSRRLGSYTPIGQLGEGQKLVYRTEPFSQVGLTLWAGGGVLFGGRWIIGASGEQVSFPVVRSINGPGSDQDEYSLSGGGGGLDLGIAAVNTGGALVFTYLHAGYYGYTLDYTNNQNEPIPFFEGEPVDAGTTASYTGAALRLALGVGFVKPLGSSGFVISSRLAYGRIPARPEWEGDEGVVENGGHTPEYNAVLFTVSIGGGGF